MAEDYGGQFGNIRKVFDEQNKKNGVEPDKTPEEIQAAKRDKILNGLREELASYQQTAQQNALDRTVATLKDKVSNGELTGENLTEAERMISDPSLITATTLDEDFGDKLPRVKELLSLIANPDRATEEADKEDFLADMRGFGERTTQK